MKPVRDRLLSAAELDRLEQVLWAVVDGQAWSGLHGRAMRRLGPPAVRQAALAQRVALNRRIRAWASPGPVPAERANEPTRGRLAARLVQAPLQRIVVPAAALGVALFLITLGFRLEGLYEAIAALVERWRGLP